MSEVSHSERKHALLSASGASRWLNCTPSPRLEEKFEEGESSFYAKEGTLAHELADIELNKAVANITEKEYRKLYAEITESEFYSDEMDEEVDKYVSYVLEQYTEAKRKNTHTLLLIEDKIDLTRFIPEGFGTNDSVIISDGVMEIADLKYGKGVTVEAENNPQLMLYGLGAFHQYELLYDIHTIKMTIVQSRLDAISTWEISSEDLVKWGLETVVPQAKKAFAGEGELVPGDHCRWCKAKPRCKAVAAMNMEHAKHDFADPELMTDEELIEVSEGTSNLIKWANSIQEYMLSEAVKGKNWPGYKLVEGRSQRRWADAEKAIKILRKKGFNKKDITQTKIKGIGAIEKLVGKKSFPEIVGDTVIKPPGSPTLVPKSDKRPAIGNEQAKEDFKS